MKKLIVAFLILTGLLFTQIGCAIPGAASVLQPRLAGLSYTVDRLDEKSVELSLILKLYNPNPVSVSLSQGTFDIFLNSIPVGTAKQQGSSQLASRSDSVLALKANIDLSRFGEYLQSHILQGENSQLSIRGSAQAGVGFISLGVPVNYDKNVKTSLLDYTKAFSGGNLPVLPGIALKSVDSSWGEVNAQRLRINHVLNFSANGGSLKVGTLKYELSGNGITFMSVETGGGVVTGTGSYTLSASSVIESNSLLRYLVSHYNSAEKSILSLRSGDGGGIEFLNGIVSLKNTAASVEVSTRLPREVKFSD